MNIGMSIRKVRQERNLKQRELAGMIGISNTYMSQIELGTSLPSQKLVEQIAIALNISVGFLYFRGLDKHDFPYNKQKLFDALYPTIQHIMTQLT